MATCADQAAVLWLAAAKEAATDNATQDNAKPINRGKPVTTITVKPCPDGYEFVFLVDVRRACAKDIVPANE